MNFKTLKFMLNKIIANANDICNSYENKPENQVYIDWYNSTWTYRTVFDELTEVLSCAFNFEPSFSLNESKRLITVTYKDELYTREDTIKLDNFGEYVLKLYYDFNTNK